MDQVTKLSRNDLIAKLACEYDRAWSAVPNVVAPCDCRREMTEACRHKRARARALNEMDTAREALFRAIRGEVET